MRDITLDLLYIGFSNGAMLGYGASEFDTSPGRAWFQPHRNHSCDFTYDGVEYEVEPDYTIPWKKRTKEQSGCCMTFDGRTHEDSGKFGAPT